nr:hypothetical protein CFP56_76377 [Quercus suber]
MQTDQAKLGQVHEIPIDKPIRKGGNVANGEGGTVKNGSEKARAASWESMGTEDTRVDSQPDLHAGRVYSEEQIMILIKKDIKSRVETKRKSCEMVQDGNVAQMFQGGCSVVQLCRVTAAPVLLVAGPRMLLAYVHVFCILQNSTDS